MGILNWGFRSSLFLYQADDKTSTKLQLKGKDDTISYSEFIKTKVPTVDTSKKLWLNPYLFNGSLQTLYYTSADTSNKFLIYYGRELFTYKDEGICSLDWVIDTPDSTEEFKKIYNETIPEGYPNLHPRSRYLTSSELEAYKTSDQEGTSPIVVILHGLAGGSHEPLIRNFAQNIKENTKNWDIVVINSRGCCRTKITTGKLFNAFSTDDIKEVLVDLKRRYPNRPIYAVGFSFGAALLANYLGEDNKDETEPLVKTACLIGAPWDMYDSSQHLQRSWTGSYLLSPALTKFLNKIVKNNFKELTIHNPELFNEENLANSRFHKKTLDFDNLYTCHTAGYDKAESYYKDASPINRVSNIRTPTFILNSRDDPAVSNKLPFDEVKASPYLSLLETELGGHLGWVQSSGKFWCVEVAEEYFKAFNDWIN